jgi:hypothetical protein
MIFAILGLICLFVGLYLGILILLMSLHYKKSVGIPSMIGFLIVGLIMCCSIDLVGTRIIICTFLDMPLIQRILALPWVG